MLNKKKFLRSCDLANMIKSTRLDKTDVPNVPNTNLDFVTTTKRRKLMSQCCNLHDHTLNISSLKIHIHTIHNNSLIVFDSLLVTNSHLRHHQHHYPDKI